jgi:hypothetical protein
LSTSDAVISDPAPMHVMGADGPAAMYWPLTIVQLPPSGIQDDAADGLLKSKHVRALASESKAPRSLQLKVLGGLPPAPPAPALAPP